MSGAPGGDSASRSGARRVLIVDGYRDSVDALAWLLSEAGCEVASCADAATALQEVLRFRPDVVFLDLRLQDGLTGIDLVRAMRRESPVPPPTIVVVSGWVRQADRAEVMAAGGDLFVAKPADPVLLISLAVGGSGPVSAA